MSIEKEATANEAIRDALKALQRTRELSDQAGYGALVLGPLADAQLNAHHALNVALG